MFTSIRIVAIWVGFALGLAFPSTTLAQPAYGSITGGVIESWEGKPLAGAVVSVRGTTLAATTDIQGRFSLERVPTGEQSLRFSKAGYAAVVVANVKVLGGEQTKVDGVLRPEFYEMEEYEVTAEVFQEQAMQILEERQQSSALLDVIGSERFARIGASDAADIVGKLPGITLSESKNPVVRGLNERYVGMQLNGAEVPSPDPYRKSAPLDLFPASVIDRVIVNKSFTADQPGNFTGGGVNILTKSFPDKFFATISAGMSYNTQATFNEEFLSYRGGGTDWLAVDDGARALSATLADPALVTPNPVYSSGLPNSPAYAANVVSADRLQELTREMKVTEFGGSSDAPPLNHNFSGSLGNTVTLAGRPFGYFGGMTYARGFSHYGDGISRRYAPGSQRGDFDIRKDYADSKSTEDVNWAAAVNLAYKVSERNDVHFNFLFNQNSEDVTRRQVGSTTDDPGIIFHLNRLHFTERNLQTFQLRGEHEFERSDTEPTRLEWLGAYSSTSQEEPDSRFFNYAEQSGEFVIGKASAPDPKNPTRYFRALDELNKNVKSDLTVPFKVWRGAEMKFKVGMFGSFSERTFVDREVYYQGDAPFAGDPNTYLTENNLGYSARTNGINRRITYTWNRYIQTRDSEYLGQNDITAAYFMVELPVLSQLKSVLGVRYEATELSVGSSSYLANSITGQRQNQTALEEGEWLPAVGLIYEVRTNMNVRFNFSQTIARPSFRELAGYRSYDPTLDELLDGNPTLAMSEIQNFDLRWEWFPAPGEVLAASVFYKGLRNAIERRYITIDGEIITFDNRETAKVFGLELEARKSLKSVSAVLADFSVGANVSLIASEVPLTHEELVARSAVLANAETTRPLYDQSPYIFNVDLNYDNSRSGTSATISYSIYGPRIVIAGLNTEDVYEQPAGLLDVSVTQRLGAGFKLRFTAKNLLNPEFERTYGIDGEYLYSSFTRGMTFGLNATWEF